jgi:hypothetical protein
MLALELREAGRYMPLVANAGVAMTTASASAARQGLMSCIRIMVTSS